MTTPGAYADPPAHGARLAHEARFPDVAPSEQGVAVCVAIHVTEHRRLPSIRALKGPHIGSGSRVHVQSKLSAARTAGGLVVEKQHAAGHRLRRVDAPKGAFGAEGEVGLRAAEHPHGLAGRAVDLDHRGEPIQRQVVAVIARAVGQPVGVRPVAVSVGLGEVPPLMALYGHVVPRIPDHPLRPVQTQLDHLVPRDILALIVLKNLLDIGEL